MMMRSVHLKTLCLSSLMAVMHQNAFAEDKGIIGNAKNIPQPNTAEACISLVSNAERLACYDTFFKASPQLYAKTPEQEAQVQDGPRTLPEFIKESIETRDLVKAAPEFSPSTSLLDQRWELSENAKLGVWQLRPYQPIYILPAMWTSNKNELPYSPNPLNRVSEPQNLNSVEAKFQLSVKTKAWENIFANNGDLWIGYTQSSRWQVYNEDESRPFRESHYEPEASLIFRTNYQFLGLNGRLFGLTLNHQSNGRSDPFSRSWNRVIFNVGLERDNLTIMLRPWLRLEEDSDKDNNPDIKDYMGRADITTNYKWRDNDFTLMLRHSLKGGEDSHGAVQFDWAFPIYGALRGHLQVFDGYGESLIDYNHRATYVGLGLSLNNWF